MRGARKILVWLACAMLFGSIFWALGPDFIQAARSYTWQKVPCHILSSKVVEEPFSSTVMHFVLRVDYTYAFGGKEYRSNRFTTGKHQGSTDIAKAERAALEFAPGTNVSCYVNPQNPIEAVLERGELWGGLFLLTPFLIVGLIAHEDIFHWFERRHRQKRAKENWPLSESNDALKTDLRLVFFGGLCLIMGIFLTGFCVVEPCWKWWHSRSWPETEAVITRCEVSQRSGQHGTEYSLALVYEYEFGGRRFRSDQRDFGHGVGEAVTDLTSWVADHPPGTRIHCFVNPAHPEEAVLEKRIQVSWMFFALGGLMLFGAGYMLGQVGQTTRARRRLSERTPADCWLGPVKLEARQLKVTPSPVWIAIGCVAAAVPLAIAGIWSLDKGLRALRHGQGDILNLLYGAGAAIAAVWFVGKFGKAVRQILAARPTVRLAPGTLTVGAEFHLDWQFRGGRPIAWVRFLLEGVEQAKVRVTNPGLHGAISEEKTEKLVFRSIPLVQASGEQAAGGSLTARVPSECMHSFRGQKCAVLWQIKVEFGRNEREKLTYVFPVVIAPPIYG